ncbi:unnamed protein product [Amoebophrya sp. A120]|nr:unnamed protein product [Amoebophrya sp. A120]|eukprot:GSA120T00021680001.1
MVATFARARERAAWEQRKRHQRPSPFFQAFSAKSSCSCPAASGCSRRSAGTGARIVLLSRITVGMKPLALNTVRSSDREAESSDAYVDDLCSVLTGEGRVVCNAHEQCVFSAKDVADPEGFYATEAVKKPEEECHQDFCGRNTQEAGCAGACLWTGSRCINQAKRDPAVILDKECRQATTHSQCNELFPRCSLHPGKGCRGEPTYDLCRDHYTAAMCQNAPHSPTMQCGWTLLDHGSGRGVCRSALQEQNRTLATATELPCVKTFLRSKARPRGFCCSDQQVIGVLRDSIE